MWRRYRLCLCGAFAASAGSVVSWGNADFGGDSRAVQEMLVHVQHILASEGAFAAILDEGSVVTWGQADSGGNGAVVRGELDSP